MQKKTAIIVIAILVVALLGTGAYAYSVGMGREKAEQIGDIHGESALVELASSLMAMEEYMHKGLYATDTALLSSMCAKASANASSALTAFGYLPYSTHELEGIADYINGTGDYTLWLSRIAADGKELDDETHTALAQLTETIGMLTRETMRMAIQYSDGALEMDEYGSGADMDEVDTVGYELRLVEEEIPEFPALQYDGMYSVKALNYEEKYLKGREKVTESAAKKIVADFISVPEERLEGVGYSESDVPCWGFALEDEDGNERSVVVTEQGGIVLSMTDACTPQDELLTLEDAEVYAKKVLKQQGYEDMEPVMGQSDKGIAMFSYAWKTNDVVCLADAVMISVSMEDGRICGYDASEYVTNHIEREIPEPAITEEQALETLPEQLIPTSSRLALFLTEGMEEIFCYEFICVNETGSGVAVYVGAMDGKQQKIELEGI